MDRTAPRYPADRPSSSPATRAAAHAALAAHGWIEDHDYRLHTTTVSRDEVLIAPIVGGNDTAPGGGAAQWQDQEHKAAWHAAARRLRDEMTRSGWTAHGSTGQGAYFRRPTTETDRAPEPDAAELAAAAPGAPVRLLAIAAGLGIGDGDLDEAVYETVNDSAADAYNNGAHPELDDERAHREVHADADHRASAINNEGVAAQLAYLYEMCASEAEFRSLLYDLSKQSIIQSVDSHGNADRRPTHQPRGALVSKPSTTPLQRVTLQVDDLAPSPRNVRTDLRLNDWFVNSVKENGVLVPLVVVPRDDSDETYEVIMGHRRLAAAQLADLDEVPGYVLDPVQREAGQEFIEQLVENASEGREALTTLEEADALFGAEQAGMDRATVVKRSGRALSAVETAVTAARTVGARTRAALAEANGYEFTTDVLAMLGEFDDDPDAVERLITAHTNGYFTHQATREREDRAQARARDERLTQLAAAGVTLVEDSADLPTGAEWLELLRDADGQRLDEAAHAACPGHLVAWNDDDTDPTAVEFYCADPAANGHALPGEQDQDGDDEETPQPGARPTRTETGLPRAVKVEGNKAWRAAEKTRREWLREDLLARKTAPKLVAAFVTRQLLVCPKPVGAWTGDVTRVALLAELLGQDKRTEARAEWAKGSATPGRLTLLNLAVLAACFEKRINEAQTWRHDNPQWDTEEIRADARMWLAFLAEIGYPLAPIEQAVISGEPYTPGAAVSGGELDEAAESAAEDTSGD